MKRLFFILAMAIVAISAMATPAIQNTFMGLTLGKASQNDVQNVLTSQGFELQTDTGGFYLYQGNWQIEGVAVKNVITRFLDDTLMMVVFANACENKCDSLKRIIDTNVEKKYGLLQSGDSSLFIKLFSYEMVSLDTEQWSRMDDETSFMYAKSDSGYVFIYLAENFIWNHLAESFSKITKETSPDYAEANKVTGVAGVKFGDDMTTIKKVIAPKSQDLSDFDAHTLTYYKTKIGGSTYDYATFYFIQGKGLVSVNLQNAFYSWKKEEAEMAYESIVSQFQRKYSNFKVRLDESEEKMCTCGAYVDDYDYPPIIITFRKSLSKGGDIMYYVTVSYYEMRRENLYDDEI